MIIIVRRQTLVVFGVANAKLLFDASVKKGRVTATLARGEKADLKRRNARR